MKKRKIKIENKKTLIFIGIVLLIAVIGGTAAYFMSQANFENRFEGLKFNVSMEEQFNGTWGTKRVKIVSHEDDNVSLLLRISYNQKWEHDGKILSNLLMGENIVNFTYPTNYASDFSSVDTSGWIYYNKEFKGGDEVVVLEAINLNTELLRHSPDLDEYLASDYTLTVNYETIRYDANEANTRWGIRPAISGSNVSWPHEG